MKQLIAFSLLLLSVLSLPAMEETITTTNVGKISVNCADPGSWKFALADTIIDGREQVTIHMTTDTAAVPPQFNVYFEFPQVDMTHLWDALGENRFRLFPNWNCANHSSLASNMPVYAIFNDNNTNRLTIAADEALRYVDTQVGIREEGSMMIANFIFFKAKEAPIKEYTLNMLLDPRPVFWANAITDATEWISQSAGLPPVTAPDAAYNPLYSTWYQFHQQVFDKDIEREVEAAAALGMKTIIVDDGWQTDDTNRGYIYSGDWKVSPRRFPDMAAHVKKVHDAGMKYMLWYAVPFIGFKSEAYPRFEGKYLLKNHELGVLDPRFPEVREYLAGIYEKAMKEWDIDGFKLDFIDSFDPIGEDPAIAENYAGRDIKSIPLAVDVLMKDIHSRLSAIKPDVLIEFRQAYIGPAIRQYGNMFRPGDCPGDAQGNRQRIANLRLTSGNAAVHADMLEWHFNETPEAAARNIISSIFSVIQYSVMLSDLPEDHGRALKHWLDFSQKHRNTLLRSEFRPYHPESIYPVIEAIAPDERIIAVYDDTSVATVADATRPAYIINGSGSASIVVENPTKPKAIAVFDTYGNKVAAPKPTAGISRLPIPLAGYALVEY